MQRQTAVAFRITPQIKREIIGIIDKRVREAHITKEDFSELKGIVADLGIKVGELAVAQKKTEAKVSELAVAQNELAIAQKKTEEELCILISEHRETRKQLGGLSHTIGFRLEDESYKALPGLLEKGFGITIKEPLKRKHIKDKEGKYLEINIVGEAIRNGKKITIIGEGKSQLSKNDVDDFIKKKLKRIEGVFDGVFPILITYMTSEHDVEEYAKKKGIALYYSYNF